jgi:hypothetical protein
MRRIRRSRQQRRRADRDRAAEQRRPVISPKAHLMIRSAFRAGAFTAAVLATIALTGCGAGDAAVNTGPFGGQQYRGDATCTIALPPHTVYTDGDLAFRNSGGTTAVIDKVSFDHVHGLRLLAAYTVPNTGQGGGYGDWGGYPPPQRDLPASVIWADRQRADGAHIPHTAGTHASVDLVLVTELTAATGTFRGISIYYHATGDHYHMDVNIVLTLRTKNNQPCPQL